MQILKGNISQNKTNTLLTIFNIILFTILFLQIAYFVIIFSRFLIEKNVEIDSNLNKKGVSIIVCAWNELDNLIELLPILANQNYPDYEVIFVNDRSIDGSEIFLKNEIELYSNFKLISIAETPAHLASKKYALSLGIKIASKELILLTDADCRPTSEHWITSMTNQLGNHNQLVLGFSPYSYEPGFLNSFIRFETFFTAWQYFSYALIGMPYMGVGRNLMYKRKLFFDNLGFRNHQKITGGDDDLFVNETANARNTAICFNENSQMVSEPKHTFAEWYIQKKRHLSIGKRYKNRDKMLLGLFSITHILSWLLLPILFFLPLQSQINIGALFIFRLLVFWGFAAIANNKLGKVVKWYSLPMFDLLLAIYYLSLGWLSILANKKIKWR